FSAVSRRGVATERDVSQQTYEQRSRAEIGKACKLAFPAPISRTLPVELKRDGRLLDGVRVDGVREKKAGWSRSRFYGSRQPVSRIIDCPPGSHPDLVAARSFHRHYRRRISFHLLRHLRHQCLVHPDLHPNRTALHTTHSGELYRPAGPS